MNNRQTSWLLVGSCVILFFASLSYVDGTDRTSRSATVQQENLTFRVAPYLVVCVVALVTTMASPDRAGRILLQQPFLAWIWYVAIAAMSGLITAIAPAWSTWKCFEMGVVTIWAAAVALHTRRTRSTDTLLSCFLSLAWACNVVVLWALYAMFAAGVTPIDYLNKGPLRFGCDWPHVNPINMGIIALYGGFVTLVGSRLPAGLQWALVSASLVAVIISKSRTPFLAIVLIVLYATLTSALSRKTKRIVAATFVLGFVCLFANASLLQTLRLDSASELLRGSGRIHSADGTTSAWGDSLSYVARSPLLGYGFLNTQRFMERDAATDNGLIQALLSSGIVGTIPLLVAIFLVIHGWTTLKLRHATKPSQRLATIGGAAAAIALAKATTTISLSVASYPLQLLFLSAIALKALQASHTRSTGLQAEGIPELAKRRVSSTWPRPHT